MFARCLKRSKKICMVLRKITWIFFLNSVIHVPAVPCFGLHPFIRCLSSGYQTTELTFGPRYCCLEALWLWKVKFQNSFLFYHFELRRKNFMYYFSSFFGLVLSLSNSHAQALQIFEIFIIGKTKKPFKKAKFFWKLFIKTL